MDDSDSRKRKRKRILEIDEDVKQESSEQGLDLGVLIAWSKIMIQP